MGSKKATKERFFILDDENPLERIDDKTVIIHFQYRELTEKEVRSYQVEGGSNTSKQDKINQKTYEDILRKINDLTTKAILIKEYKNEKPLLLYQISRFTAKNTKDYFIHKNLKKFLSEQLDYFIKAEVLSIETLEKEKFLDKHITRAKVVREITPWAPHIVYVNGQSVLTPKLGEHTVEIRYIEPEFKKLMEG